MFEWKKHHKVEQQIDYQITEQVRDYILEYYEVETIEDLSENHIEEIEKFRSKTLNEYSYLQLGFSNLVYQWEENRGD